MIIDETIIQLFLSLEHFMVVDYQLDWCAEGYYYYHPQLYLVVMRCYHNNIY